MTSKKLLHISVTAVLVLSVLAIFTACASSEDYTFVTEWGRTNLFIERNRIFSLDLEQK